MGNAHFGCTKLLLKFVVVAVLRVCVITLSDPLLCQRPCGCNWVSDQLVRLMAIQTRFSRSTFLPPLHGLCLV